MKRAMRRALWTCSAVAMAGAAVWLPTASAVHRTPPIVFHHPAVLPHATVGVPYSYSFCKPPAAQRCGKPAGATNPSGGFEHYYVFTIKSGHIPKGMGFSTRTGLLRGVAVKKGISRFLVCAADAERRPGVAPKPACGATSLTVEGDEAKGHPTTTTPGGTTTTTTTTTPDVTFTGLWANGSFRTTSVGDNACGSAASGSVQLSLTQNGKSVSGQMSYQVTSFTQKPNAPSGCLNLTPSGSIPMSNATVDGSTLTGSGFALTQTSPTTLTGTYTGVVQGIQITVTISATR